MRRGPPTAARLLIHVVVAGAMQLPAGGFGCARALRRPHHHHLAWQHRRALSASAAASGAAAHGGPTPPAAADDEARDLRCLIRVQDAVGAWRRRRPSASTTFPPLDVRYTPGDPFAAAMLAQEDDEGEEEEQQDQQQLLSSRPGASSFCTNCCTPLVAVLGPEATGEGDPPCPNCGHRPSEDAALLGLAGRRRAPSPGLDAVARAAAALREARRLLALELEAQQGQGQGQGNNNQLALPSGAPLVAWDDDGGEGDDDHGPSSSSPYAAPMARHRAALPPHPDRPERVRAVVARLRATGLAGLCERVPTRPATDDELLRVHTPAHVAAVDALGGLAFSGGRSNSGGGGGGGNGALDARAALLRSALASGTLPPEMLGAGPATAAAARFAAGTAADLASRLLLSSPEGGPRCALALVRPAGTLASRTRAAGGAYFNNAAVAARSAQAAAAAAAGAGGGGGAQSAPPLLRVMIVSVGASAAVGTAEVFAGDPSVLCASLHAAPPPPKRRPSGRRRGDRGLGGGGGGLFPRAEEDDFDRVDEEEEEDDEEEEEVEADDDDDDAYPSGAYFPAGAHHLARASFTGVGRGKGFTVNVAWEAAPQGEERRRQGRRSRRRRSRHARGRPASPPELLTPSPEPQEGEEEEEERGAALGWWGGGGGGVPGLPGDGDHAQAVATLLQPLAAEFRPALVVVCVGTDALAPPAICGRQQQQHGRKQQQHHPRPAPALSPEGLASTVASLSRLAPRALLLLEDGGGGGAAGLPGGDLRSSARAFELIVRSAMIGDDVTMIAGGAGAGAAAAAAGGGGGGAVVGGGGTPLGWASVLRAMRALEGSWACAALPRWLDALGGVGAEDGTDDDDDDDDDDEAGWTDDDDEGEGEDEGEEEEGADATCSDGDEEEDEEAEEDEEGRMRRRARAGGGGGEVDDDEGEDDDEGDVRSGFVEENDGCEEDEEDEEDEDENASPRVPVASSSSSSAPAPPPHASSSFS